MFSLCLSALVLTHPESKQWIYCPSVRMPLKEAAFEVVCRRALSNSDL